MPRPKPLNDSDVALAYARHAIEGEPHHTPRGFFGGDHGPVRIKRAIALAIQRGIIAHSGNIDRGWLTEKGIDWLHPVMQKRYRDALRGRNMARAG